MEGISKEATRIYTKKDVAVLGDPGLVAAHYYAHMMWRQTREGEIPWGAYNTAGEIREYHTFITQELQKRGISHMIQDSLDPREGVKSVSPELKETFLAIQEWESSHPKTSRWVLSSALLLRNLKGQKVLEIGSGSGEFLRVLGLSGFYPLGIEIDKEACSITTLKGLLAINEDALVYLKSCSDKIYDSVCSSHAIEHLENPAEVMKECERVASTAVIHVIPLGKGRCLDHKTEWENEDLFDEWLSKEGLKDYYVIRSGDEVLVKKDLGLSSQLQLASGMRSVMATPDYISIAGSTVKGKESPADLDVVIREKERIPDLELQLTKQIRAKGYEGDLEFVYNPTGPHGSYLPLYDNMLVKKTDLKVREISVEDAKAQEEEVKGNLNKPQKCAYCKEPAVVAYIWADGRAYIPVCNTHRDKAKHQIEVINKDKVTFVRDLPHDDSKALPEKPGSPYGRFFSPLKPSRSYLTFQECWDDWAEGVIEKGVSIYVEQKLDGYRIRPIGCGKGSTILGPSDVDVQYSKALPIIKEEINKVDKTILDGEAILYGKGGRAEREELAVLFSKEPAKEMDDRYVVAWVFDSMSLEGEWIDELPYSERRAKLKEFMGKHKGVFKHIKLLPSFPADTKEEFFEYAEAVSKVEGSEGAMFKAGDSVYTWGEVTGDWAKVKSVKEVFCEVITRTEVKPVPGRPPTYVYELGVKDEKGEVIPCGNSMASVVSAMVGAILEIRIDKVWKTKEGYSLLLPRVIEIRKDMSKPSSAAELEKMAEESSEGREGVVKSLYRMLGKVTKKVFANGYMYPIEDTKAEQLVDEGGERGTATVEKTVGLINSGDKGRFVLQTHDIMNMHLDLRLEIPQRKGNLAKYTIYVPRKVCPEHYGADACRDCAKKVARHLLEGGHFAGNVTPNLVPEPWLHVGVKGVHTLPAGSPGASVNKDAHMFAVDYGQYEAGPCFEEHMSAFYKLKGKVFKDRWLMVVAVKPQEMGIQIPELAGVGGRLWLFSLLEPGAEPKEEI